jgi:sugar phosphate isomerase/epimerase
MTDEGTLSRRNLLKGSAAVAATAAITSTSRGAFAAPKRAAVSSSAVGRNLPSDRIGVQLYSVGDQATKMGWGKLLPALAEIGYKYVEFAGYASTPKYTPKQIRRILDDNGLYAIGNHGQMDRPSIDAGLTLGQRYTGISVLTSLHGLHTDAWKQTADDLNAYGEKCVKAGLKGFYIHMHGPEYIPVADNPTLRAIDVLLKYTDPRYVFWEMDIYWAYFFQGYLGGGGALYDPLKWVLQAPKRFPLFHVKDGHEVVKTSVGGTPVHFQWESFGGEDTFPLQDGITDIGQGDVNFKNFFGALAKKSNLRNHYFIWERDTASSNPHGSLTSARSSYLMMAHDHMAARSAY